MSNLNELRAHPRYEKRLEVTMYHGDIESAGLTRNLSIGGLCVETEADFSVGDEVEVKLKLPALPEHVNPTAVVCWLERLPEGGFLVGLQFGRADGTGPSVLPAMWLWALNKFLAQSGSDHLRPPDGG